MLASSFKVCYNKHVVNSKGVIKMKNVEVLESNKLYRINFNIPVSLRESYNAFVENSIGYDNSAILNDVVEEEVDGRIKGYVEVEWESFNLTELEDIANNLNTLSSGSDIYVYIQ